jgi:hypothetical protein
MELILQISQNLRVILLPIALPLLYPILCVGLFLGKGVASDRNFCKRWGRKMAKYQKLYPASLLYIQNLVHPAGLVYNQHSFTSPESFSNPPRF